MPSPMIHEYSRCWAEVDLDNLRHNLRTLRGLLAPGAKHCFVIKADGYGHGLLPVAQCAVNEGVEWLAVATVSEGIALRQAGISCPILVLAPILSLDCDVLVRYDLRNLVEELAAAQALAVAARRQGRSVRVHLKVDTGMARFGAQPEEAVDLACSIADIPCLVLEGIATHFSSCAVDLPYTHKQYEGFIRIVEELERRGLHVPLLHCANSAALIRMPKHVQHALVRSGLLAFGIRNVPCPDVDLRPVLTWRTRIMALREIPAGRRVGYGGTWTTEKRTRIATLGTGYADGYPRELSNKGCVLIHGQEAPIRGIVCMDQTMVDVTRIPEARVGDVVGLVEGPITAERLAEWVGTTPHEIPCRLTGRVPRIYLNE
ncbi:MAG: alanine racemase [Fimbriimonadia bacterium]